MKSSPLTPTGTGCNAASSTYSWQFWIGRPIGTGRSPIPGWQLHQLTSTEASVGP